MSTVVDRIMAHVIETPGPLDTPCWVCTYAQNYSGYTRINDDGRIRRCHRAMYEEAVGAIPDGLVCDHICRVRNCVNPAHIEIITQRANVLRGDHPLVLLWRTNTCKRGHSLDGAYLAPDGSRRCRTCQDEHNVRYNAARRASYVRVADRKAA